MMAEMMAVMILMTPSCICKKNNNQISINEIAALLNISKRKCERVIAELKRIGKVKRIGSPRKGYWVVM